MSVIRTIKCNVEGCCNTESERTPNAGWPGWGVLQGRANGHGETDFHVCPEHLDATFRFLDTLGRR